MAGIKACRLNYKQLLMKGVAFFIFSVFSSTHVLADGEVSGLKAFEYWDNGRIKLCTMYDAGGILKAKAFCRYDGTVEKVERFDSSGNKIEEAIYDGRGRLKAGLDGWAAMRWWYEDSRLASQISYDEEGRPIERKQYAGSGRLILRQYREEMDDLVPYEAATMAIMLGGRNLRYFDSNTKAKD